jgi:hypothetical protein
MVALITVVGRGDPFHNTTELASNPVPVTVIVAAAPGGTTRGDIAVMTATGLFTTNDAPADVPPPGAGFCAVIWLRELPAKRFAGTVAFISVALTNVAVNGVPFHTAVVAEMKLDPVMSTTVSPAPAVTAAGDRDAMEGTGLLAAGGGVTDPELPPPQPLRSKTNARIQGHTGRTDGAMGIS